MKRGPVLRPHRPPPQRVSYARACKMQNTRVRVRATLPSRDLLCDHRAFSPSQRAFFFFHLPFLTRDCEPSAPGHPSWILMDGDSRTRRIPADADPQEGRMRTRRKLPLGVELIFDGPSFPLLPPFSCGFLTNAPLGVNVYVVVAAAAL